MSILEEAGPDIEPGLSGAEVANGSGSILDKIKRRKEARTDELTIDLPSWDGDLKAVYQLLDRREIEKMAQRIRAAHVAGKKPDGTTADIDFLIKSCIGIIAYDVEEDIDERIADGFDMSLVQKLDPKDKYGKPVEITDQRQLVAYLTGWNNVALGYHAQKVGRWMQDTSKHPEDPS